MLRLCLTLGASLVLAGCTGRNLEGRWEGKLPLGGADNCRIRLLKGRDFDAVCTGDAEYVARGRYEVRDDALILRFAWLAVDERPQKRLPENIHLSIQGGGNELQVSHEGTPLGAWRRTMD